MGKYENLLESGTGNIVQSFYDNYLKSNADFRAKAGLKMTVTRESIGHCCDWCSKMVGTYDYDKCPADIYRRHENCTCIVTTRTERGTYQDAWSRKEYESQREARIARAEEIEKDINSNTKIEPTERKKRIDAITDFIQTQRKKNAVESLADIYLKYGSQEKLMLQGSVEDIEKWMALQKASGVTEKEIVQWLYQDVDKWEQILENQTSVAMKAFTDQLFEIASFEEIDAMSFWSGGAYENIQQFLRYGDNVNDIYKDAADKIVSALDRITTNENLIVRRGTGTRHIFADFGDEWKRNPEVLVGKIFPDDGLVSTSPFKDGGFGGVGDNHAEFFIKVPKGTHGAYIADVTKNPDEKEFLLQKGYSYRIIKVEYRDSKYSQLSDVKNLKVWVEVILNE